MPSNRHNGTRKAGIDERAFPYDRHGAEKPYYRAQAGLAVKHRDNHEQFLEQTQQGGGPKQSRRQETFHAYTFKLKTGERPQSAPAYGTDLGGSLAQKGARGGGNNAPQPPPPKPKMRPNSAHFLSTSSTRRGGGLDVFPAPRPHSSGQHVFVHPTPPTDDVRILTHHEQMFYTRHFAKLSVKNSENEKYKLDDDYNRQSRYFDHTTTTVHAPSNEDVTDYRLGRKRQAFPPRVVQHRKAGLQQSRGVSQKLNNGIARNALGGFYS